MAAELPINVGGPTRDWFRCGGSIFDLNNLSPNDCVLILRSFTQVRHLPELELKHLHKHLRLTEEQAVKLLAALQTGVPEYEAAMIESRRSALQRAEENQTALNAIKERERKRAGD